MGSKRRGGRRSLQWYRRAPSQEQSWLPLIDANGGVGSIASSAVGAVEPQEEDAGGELLHDFLGKCDLLAADTFDGTGRRTWVPARGQEARIDCVVCRQRWLPMLQRAGTADFSPATADKEYHRPVLAKFVLRNDCGTTGECEDDKRRITF